MGKCCLRFKDLDDLGLTSVAKLIAMSTPKDYIAYYKRTKGLTMRAAAPSVDGDASRGSGIALRRRSALNSA